VRWLIAAHDAGGAEVVSAWVRRHPENEYRYLLGETAKRIFADKLRTDPVHASGSEITDDAFDGVGFVLAGSSWSSDLEKRVVRDARRRHIPSAVYLDHWINYRERFGYPRTGWMTNLPDSLWCGDEEALRIAESLKMGVTVTLVPNPYLEDLAEEFASLKKTQGAPVYDFLYVAEPIRDHMEKDTGNPLHLGYDEFTALRYALETLTSPGSALRRLLLRTHPAERSDKYDALVSASPASIQIDVSSKTKLLEDIARCYEVIGCESMAMAIARSLGRRIYTAIPPGGRPCVLPFLDIIPIAHRKGMPNRR
jgi:hypothetical protein